MAQLLEFPSFKDQRGSLTVIEKALPFNIQRVYYIYDTNQLPRAGHAHVTGYQALICLHKTCAVRLRTGQCIQDILLLRPDQCLILEASEWHTLTFEPGAILLVLASTYYDPDNYIPLSPQWHSSKPIQSD